MELVRCVAQQDTGAEAARDELQTRQRVDRSEADRAGHDNPDPIRPLRGGQAGTPFTPCLLFRRSGQGKIIRRVAPAPGSR